MPYLCWIHNNDTQQEIIGVNNCAIDVLNNSPTYKKYILLIAHNSDDECILIFKKLQNVKPIVKSNRFLQIKATCYNPIQKRE